MAAYTPIEISRRVLARAEVLNDNFAAISAALADLPDGTEINEGRQNFYVTGGLANAYTITADPAPAAYVEGMTYRVEVHATNTAASSVDVNSLGARAIKTALGADVKANALTVGSILDLTFDGTNFRIISASVAGDVNLTAFSGLAAAADRLPYFSSTSAMALAAFTAFGRSLVDDATASDALTTLGVSTFIKTLLDDLDAAAARGTIGAAASTTALTAGAGLLGGGDLSIGRDFAVGAGDGISVLADSVAVNATVVRTSGAQSIAGGKTFTDTPNIAAISPSLRLEDTDNAGAGKYYWLHLNSDNLYVLRDSNADGAWESPHPLQLIGSSSRVLAWGNEVLMGLPGTLTATSTNTAPAGGVGHTHEVDEANIVANGTAALGADGVGTYALLAHATAGTALSLGSNYAGSALDFAGLYGDGAGVGLARTGAPTGTWKSMGYGPAVAGEHTCVPMLRIA